MNFLVSVVTMRGSFFLLPFEGPSTIGPILGPSVVDVVFSNAAPTQWSWSTARQPPSLVSSSYVFVSIVTVVSFYLTGRQLPLKKRWCTRKDRNKAAKKSTRQSRLEPILSNLQTLLDPVAKPSGFEVKNLGFETPLAAMELLAPRTAEESLTRRNELYFSDLVEGRCFSCQRSGAPPKTCVFFLFPGVVFFRRGTPRPKPCPAVPLVFFWGYYSRDRMEFSRLNFFHPLLFCVFHPAPRFRSPSKPRRCVILLPPTGRPGGERS